MEKELRRRRWIVRRKLDGWTNSTIASHLRISKRTVIRWWKVYQEEGWDGLVIKSRRPHTIHRTPENVVDKVIEIREQHNYGPNKIEAELKRHDMRISHNTIHRILIKHDLNNPIDKPRKTWGKKKFEREHSNSLWQTDFKLTEDDRWMVTFLDDHSRFVIGCKIDDEATSERAIQLLEKCINKFERPKQILSDRGIQFFCNEKEDVKEGISGFTQFCIDNDIEHIVASKRRPTTIGKVERWHLTYEIEHQKYKSLRWFIHYYNFKRINQAIGYLTPSEVYFRDRVTHVVG